MDIESTHTRGLPVAPEEVGALIDGLGSRVTASAGRSLDDHTAGARRAVAVDPQGGPR